MSLFKNLTTDNSIEADKDTLGTSKFAPWESGVYDTVIDLAYVDESKGGATSVNFVFKTEDGKELRQNIFVTSGKDKGQLNYYVDKKGIKKYLPGFTAVNDICLLTVGEPLADIETEEKVLNLYNFDLGKEAPTKKQVLTDLIGAEVTLAVNKIIQDKYNKPGEVQTINEISKVFRASDHMTANEIRDESETAEFYDLWAEKNTGRVIDKSGRPKSEVKTEDKPKKSLFGK